MKKIPIPGRTQKERDKEYRRIISDMEKMGFNGISCICTSCGEEGICFDKDAVLEDGFLSFECSICKGRLKVL